MINLFQPSIPAISQRSAWFFLVAFSLCVLLTVQAIGQEDLFDQEQAAFKNAAAYAAPSVVQVETFAGAELLDQQKSPQTTTTGTIVDSEGWIVTSLFYFRTAPASITVRLSDDTRLPAKLVARDFNREIALLKVSPAQPMKPAELSERATWRVGQWVVAVGRTISAKTVSPSVGIISAMGRVWDKAIQTDAKISPLNYGGPLVDLYGRAIGLIVPINPGIATEGEVQQWYDSGVGFVVPMDDILSRLAVMKEGKDLYPGKLGIRSLVADDYSGPIILKGVTPGSPAAKIGLRPNDELLKIDDRPVKTLGQMRHVLGPKDAGQSVSIEYRRGDKVEKTDCTLVKEIPVYREPFLGVVPSLIGKKPGVTIEYVAPNSAAEKAGLKAGDVIQSLNNQPVKDRVSLRELLSFCDLQDPVQIGVVDASDAARTVTQKLTAWPGANDAKLPKMEVPTFETPAEPGKGIVSLELGDVRNKAFVLIPSSYRTEVPHGLMIVFAEAGELQTKAWADAWEPFCRDHRWIMAVIGSADKEGWSFEELEIVDRILFPMMNDYKIDAQRVSFGGIGTGGVMSIVASIQHRTKVRGAWFFNAKVPGRVRIPPAEPMESLRYMGFGQRADLDKLKSTVEPLGHHFLGAESTVATADFMQKPINAEIEAWLRGLELQ